MMNMTYGCSPVRLIEGIPAFKAGEWPGIKSNRFGLTKRVIRPEKRNPMFDGNILYSTSLNLK